MSVSFIKNQVCNDRMVNNWDTGGGVQATPPGKIRSKIWVGKRRVNIYHHNVWMQFVFISTASLLHCLRNDLFNKGDIRNIKFEKESKELLSCVRID